MGIVIGFDVVPIIERVLMRKGDILLISYRFDPVGWIIRYFTKCPFNHCAWAISNKTLIELKATGKRITPLKKYLNRWLYKCKLVKPQLADCKLNETIRRAEKAQFNYSYTSAIINFILVKLKILKKSPRLSCSAFPAYYLSQVGFNFCNKNPHFITPKDIEESLYVEEIDLND